MNDSECFWGVMVIGNVTSASAMGWREMENYENDKMINGGKKKKVMKIYIYIQLETENMGKMIKRKTKILRKRDINY